MTTHSPLDQTELLRKKPAFVLWGLLLGGFCLAVSAAPIVGLIMACLQGDSQVSVTKFRKIFASERVWQLLSKTALIALLTASISAGLGWGVDCLLRKVGERLARLWIALFAGGFLLSPYVYTQGWIGWIGNHGLLWKLFGSSSAPFTIYSTSGVIGMLVISNLSLAIAFIYLSRRIFPANVFEAAKLFQMPSWRQLRLVEFPAVAPGLAAAFLWAFVLSFWAYDIPSMLRQNMFSLEVLAAFGSFYDYGRGVLLAVPPVFMIVALGCASGFFWRKRSYNFSRFVEARGAAAWPNAVLALIPMFTWAIPMIGLVLQIPGFKGFLETALAARTDIINSVRYGFVTTCFAVISCFALAFFLRGLCSSNRFRLFFLLPLPWMALPAIVIGMGYVYLLNLQPATAITKFGWQLVLVELTVLMPIVGMLMMVQLNVWPDEWTQAGRMFGLGALKQLLRIATPLFFPGIAAVFAIGFALAIREVPASLINYPPGGGTVAISIETLLHFDQPEKVAALCVVQMLLLFLGCLPFLGSVALAKYVHFKLPRCC